jgi:hypothetical protein
MTGLASRSLATAVLILATAAVAHGQEATTAALPSNPYTPPACVPGVPFSDITCTTGFDPWIEQFGADGITAGCGGGLYCPTLPVTREQMAVFIEKAMRGTATWSPGDAGGGNTSLGWGAGLNTSSYNNTAVGFQSLYANTSNSNTAIGNQSGFTNTTGSANTFVGDFADAASGGLTQATAIGFDAIVDASYHVRIGNANVTQIGGQVGWTNLSDARAKTDIRDLDLGLDFVMALRPVSFTLRQGNGRTDMGFVAQDVEALLGDGFNVLGIGGDKDRTLSLRYTDLMAPMVKAIQEQQATIEAQKAQLEALKVQHKSQLEAVLARVAKLEAAAHRQHDRLAAAE